MIATSSAWKEYVKYSSVFHIKATMYDNDQNSIPLTDSDFMLGSISFTDAMSGMSEIEFGAVVTNSFSATLNNFDGKFDDWKWETISVEFGIERESHSSIVGSAIAGWSVVGTDGTDEWIHRGTYYIDRPLSIGNTINIECYDAMDKFNIPFIGLNETLTYPIQSNTLISELNDYCRGGSLYNDFTDFTIDEFEVDETTTCRQVLSWILQTLGGYARMSVSNADDILVCDRWTIGEWGDSDTLDGGVFDTWNTVGTADGGTFDPWDVTTDINGGNVYEGQDPYEIENIKTSTIMIDDIEITGIRAISYDNSTSSMVGDVGYIILIQDNPLVSDSNTSAVATRAWGDVEGLKIRPFEASIFGDPSMEAGDVVIIKDIRGNYHLTTLTTLKFTLGGDMRISCDALTPEELKHSM